MPALPEQHIKSLKLVKSSSHPLDYQPAGVDLRVQEIEMFSAPGQLGRYFKALPEMVKFPPNANVEIPTWDLRPGHYLVTFMEEVDLPHDVVAYLHPRSSLLRMGLSLQTAVWDPGYNGRGQSLLIVHNPKGVRLERGARIAQMTFHRLEQPAESGYSGSYQYEGLTRRGIWSQL